MCTDTIWQNPTKKKETNFAFLWPVSGMYSRSIKIRVWNFLGLKSKFQLSQQKDMQVQDVSKLCQWWTTLEARKRLVSIRWACVYQVSFLGSMWGTGNRPESKDELAIKLDKVMNGGGWVVKYDACEDWPTSEVTDLGFENHMIRNLSFHLDL